MTMVINTLQSLTLLSCVVSHVMTHVIDHGDVYVRTLANSTNVGEYLSLGGPINSWMPIAKTECIIACAGLGRECGAVEFDEMSGNCTIGEMVVRNNGIPHTQQRNTTMFFSSSRIPGTCNETSGFSYKVKLNTHVCIHFSMSEKIHRIDSVTACEEKGGSLYMPNSVEKMSILREYLVGYSNKRCWIGLRKYSKIVLDYVWEDMVEFKKSDSFWETFWSETPSVEDTRCVIAKEGATAYKPINCGYKLSYACEMPPF